MSQRPSNKASQGILMDKEVRPVAYEWGLLARIHRAPGVNHFIPQEAGRTHPHATHLQSSPLRAFKRAHTQASSSTTWEIWVPVTTIPVTISVGGKR
jgi:hypothetical protein